MITFLTAVHLITIALLIIVVLLQSGKGAEISASFGGSSQTVFGASGGANVFQKATYFLAGVFMCTSLALTILPNKVKRSVFEGYSAPAPTTGSLPAGGTSAGNPGTTLPVGGDAPEANKGEPVSGVAQIPGQKVNANAIKEEAKAKAGEKAAAKAEKANEKK